MTSPFAVLATLFAFMVIQCCGQIKTSIGTSGNTQSHFFFPDHVPAPNYPNPGSYHLQEVAKFLNKTKQAMASGVCYQQVPTISLAKDKSLVPAGNGTDPKFSKVQVCCDGYERNPHIWTRCDPICKDNCRNGICSAPNTCLCLPGYIRNYQDKCVATCPLGCGDGVCQPDGTCKCKPGYKLEPTGQQFCIPHCSKECLNGNCLAPEECQCNDGFEASIEGICEPVCENCEHGTCSKPGECICDPGYLQSATACEPVCTKGCNKGTCIAPEVCSCPTGYELDRTGINCVPHCDKPCLNGFCDGQNICTCNPGYILDENRNNVCKPHCPDGCPNGFCSAPNLCICRAGFVKTGVKGRKLCTPA